MHDAGIKMETINYPGQPSAIADLITGRVQFMTLGLILAEPQIKAGKLEGAGGARPASGIRTFPPCRRVVELGHAGAGDDDLVRHRDAGEDARGDRRPRERGDHEGARRCRKSSPSSRRWASIRRKPNTAGGFRDVHAGGRRAVEERGQDREHRGGLRHRADVAADDALRSDDPRAMADRLAGHDRHAPPAVRTDDDPAGWQGRAALHDSTPLRRAAPPPARRRRHPARRPRASPTSAASARRSARRPSTAWPRAACASPTTRRCRCARRRARRS